MPIHELTLSSKKRLHSFPSPAQAHRSPNTMDSHCVCSSVPQSYTCHFLGEKQSPCDFLCMCNLAEELQTRDHSPPQLFHACPNTMQHFLNQSRLMIDLANLLCNFEKPGSAILSELGFRTSRQVHLLNGACTTFAPKTLEILQPRLPPKFGQPAVPSPICTPRTHKELNS